MAKRSNYHVVPSPNGGWSVRREGADRVAGVFNRKSEALEHGRRLAHSTASELVVHGKDGRIRDSTSTRHDPFPPRDQSWDKKGPSPKGFGSLGGKIAIRRDIDITKPIYEQATRDSKKGEHRGRSK